MSYEKTIKLLKRFEKPEFIERLQRTDRSGRLHLDETHLREIRDAIWCAVALSGRTQRTSLLSEQSAGWAKQVIDLEKPVRMFIDVGGVGAGVYDRLVEMGFGDIVRAVNFGSQPMEPPPLDPHGKPSGSPVNRRAEMWMKSREWLEDPAGVQIPDSDSLQADACGPGYKYDSHTRLQLEGKDQMRARGAPALMSGTPSR